MRILLADDDAVSLTRLRSLLERGGDHVVLARDGDAAWSALQESEAPRLAILDWEMPGVEGPDLCRRVRADARLAGTYVILLTAHRRGSDVVEGLEAGADDYVAKPFDPDELRARVHVGQRVLGLQQRLEERVEELERALSQVRRLEGLLPMCAWCKKVRDERDYWQRVEEYVEGLSGAHVTHGMCPECFATETARLRKGGAAPPPAP
jgi:DNA-binding response OmpR family regulator